MSLKVHGKTFIYGQFSKKNILIKICFKKIRVRLRVQLQGPCTRLQKSVHVAALVFIFITLHSTMGKGHLPLP